ncbi:GNAT family N-acetyltransferase [Flavobacteriaceae bacterium F89]|uniref:GNAT family N-acetyltransferase n=1 Tax=Cerina litoralis TaxID=2874477 RepID=A0AAE3EVT7_9FLAO|nr:GNAT family N-acetyltransferase [Cerina litoralis]MCG2460506.1 GNAT family N-acetyltransferase [Cerina litoralis]
MDTGLQINSISAAETYPIRQPVLRPGKPLASCVFDGDDFPTTFHLGGFYKNRLVAVATFMEHNQLDHKSKIAVQVRGMAVLKEYQGRGFGKLLLNFGEKLLLDRRIKTVWMNAREIAVPFYKNCGYNTIGKAFIIPGIGIHFVMLKNLS